MSRRKRHPPPEGVGASEFMRHTWASGLPRAYQHGWLTRLIAERDGTQAALDFIAWYEAFDPRVTSFEGSVPGGP